MTPILVFSCVAVYFSMLIFVSWWTGRKSDNATFFTAHKKSPWYLVAFGMIGTSISGVTFISVPGEVGTKNFFYFQMVLGYLVGYFVIGNVLLPLYYKLNLVSIYTYLQKRFGELSYKTGSALFIVSRTIGASFRVFLVSGVLQIGFFDALDIPFYFTVIITIGLIFAYTYKAGIKTIVWTDTLQTVFLLTALVLTIILVGNQLNLSFAGIVKSVIKSEHSQIFDWDWHTKTNFFKQFFGGAFIAIVMTGLDQDLMQKNLTCKNLKEAKKNMFWFSLSLIPINLFFLSLGALLYIYVAQMGIAIPVKSDDLYPMLAFQYFNPLLGIVFLIGIIAATFASADSALTSLTIAFSIDFLKVDVNDNSGKTKNKRLMTHLGFSVLMILVILLFRYLNDSSVISAVFTVASYTYGPLLGLFAFGLFTKRKTVDRYVPFIAIASPIICYILNMYSADLLWGYKFGFELLILNGMLTFAGLLMFSNKTLKIVGS